jgi:hypothetical protein
VIIGLIIFSVLDGFVTLLFLEKTQADYLHSLPLLIMSGLSESKMTTAMKMHKTSVESAKKIDKEVKQRATDHFDRILDSMHDSSLQGSSSYKWVHDPHLETSVKEAIIRIATSDEHGFKILDTPACKCESHFMDRDGCHCNHNNSIYFSFFPS